MGYFSISQSNIEFLHTENMEVIYKRKYNTVLLDESYKNEKHTKCIMTLYEPHLVMDSSKLETKYPIIRFLTKYKTRF